MKEIWKDIKGYEGLYKVSNKGRVKTMARKWKIHKGSYIKNKPMILKFDTRKKGYYRVSLYNGDKYKHYFVHRLVADAFIPKIDGKDFINHKDFNGHNNNVNNLEWVTQKENSMYSRERSSLARLKIINSKSGEHFIYIISNPKKPYRFMHYKPNHTKCFSTLEEAIKYRDEYMKKIK